MKFKKCKKRIKGILLHIISYVIGLGIMSFITSFTGYSNPNQYFVYFFAFLYGMIIRFRYIPELLK